MPACIVPGASTEPSNEPDSLYHVPMASGKTGWDYEDSWSQWKLMKDSSSWTENLTFWNIQVTHCYS